MGAAESKLAELEKQLQTLSQQVRRMSAGGYSHASGRRGRIECYRDDQVSIGLVVATKVSGEWIRVRVVDVAEWKEKVQGSYIYAIERVDPPKEGKKTYDLGPKWARDLFPVERVDGP